MWIVKLNTFVFENSKFKCSKQKPTGSFCSFDKTQHDSGTVRLTRAIGKFFVKFFKLYIANEVVIRSPSKAKNNPIAITRSTPSNSAIQR